VQAIEYDGKTVQRSGTRGMVLFNTSLLAQLTIRPYGAQTLRLDFANGVSFFGTIFYDNSFRQNKDYLYRDKRRAPLGENAWD
jgi:hypothetical protein